VKQIAAHMRAEHPKIRRRLIAASAMICTVFTLTLMALWIDSQFTDTGATFKHSHPSRDRLSGFNLQVQSFSGRIDLLYSDGSLTAPTPKDVDSLNPYRRSGPDLWHFWRYPAQGRVAHSAANVPPPLGWFAPYWRHQKSDERLGQGPLQVHVQSIMVALNIRALVLISAALSALLLLQWRRQCLYLLRARQGQCVRCGYDLRSNSEPGGKLLDICPECGSKSGKNNGDGVSCSC
jgi:hypothetical protein